MKYTFTQKFTTHKETFPVVFKRITSLFHVYGKLGCVIVNLKMMTLFLMIVLRNHELVVFKVRLLG